MQLGKMAHIGGKWVRISLTEEESREAFEELVKLNMRELTRVTKFVRQATLTDINQMEATRMLFEKQGVSAYTYLINKVDEKIEELKNPEGNVVAKAITQKGKGMTLEPDLEAENPFEAGATEDEYAEVNIEVPKKKKGLFG